MHRDTISTNWGRNPWNGGFLQLRSPCSPLVSLVKLRPEWTTTWAFHCQWLLSEQGALTSCAMILPNTSKKTLECGRAEALKTLSVAGPNCDSASHPIISHHIPSIYTIPFWVFWVFLQYNSIIPCNPPPSDFEAPSSSSAWRRPILRIIAQDEDWHRCPEAVIR